MNEQLYTLLLLLSHSLEHVEDFDKRHKPAPSANPKLTMPWTFREHLSSELLDYLELLSEEERLEIGFTSMMLHEIRERGLKD